MSFRGVCCLVCCIVGSSSVWASPQLDGKIDNPVDLVMEKRATDASVYRMELGLTPYEAFLSKMWGAMLESENGLDVLLDLPLGKVEKAVLVRKRKLPERVFEYAHDLGDEARSYIASGLVSREIEKLIDAGYVLEQSYWNFTSLEYDELGRARTGLEFELHVVGPSETMYRRVFRGELLLTWDELKAGDAEVKLAVVDIQRLKMLRRSGVVGFRKKEWLESGESHSPYGVVLVEDVDGDGLLDVLFPSQNVLYRNQGGFHFEPDLFVTHRVPGRVGNALLVDLDLDGELEYVLGVSGTKLYIYDFNPKTKSYDKKPIIAWKGKVPMLAKSLSAGDITGDGYPDLYYGQYSFGYGMRSVPYPFYDDNSGRSSHLLRNKGGLKFESMPSKLLRDVKMNRRTNMVGFVDFDRDNRKELLVLSDFGGIDLYRYDDDGYLTDCTSECFGDKAVFGRGYSLGDFNRDGIIDMYVAGWSSEAVRRIDSAGITREGFEDIEEKRSDVAGGGVLFLGRGDGTFSRSSMSDEVGATGFASGSGALDFNNDGFEDLFVANGFMSGKTTLNYDSTFWRHDIYASSLVTNRRVIAEYGTLLDPLDKIHKGHVSWDGFELDKFFISRGGEEYINYAYLMGLSSVGDGRSVLAEDFDNDGKVDLLVSEVETIESNRKIVLYKNQQSSKGAWIGVDIRPAVGSSIIGTRVRVIADGFETEKVYVLGSVYVGQPSSRLHFGLGAVEKIVALEIVWPNGKVDRIENPDLRKYYKVSPAVD